MDQTRSGTTDPWPNPGPLELLQKSKPS